VADLPELDEFFRCRGLILAPGQSRSRALID
jgi:hypothetical protein